MKARRLEIAGHVRVEELVSLHITGSARGTEIGPCPFYVALHPQTIHNVRCQFLRAPKALALKPWI
jgi:hypothetical protein